ncbi:hypothetical protein [Curtobacterium sp. VKM Ac-2884]|nr:hypothetical protein [Curtobacterium sp. VKM Ac-2884]MBF4603743.1 hypothetical protein [Curtobacterium sp. VKM Ac-2884]
MPNTSDAIAILLLAPYVLWAVIFLGSVVAAWNIYKTVRPRRRSRRR